MNTVSKGDVIGIGIHTLNALRGYEVGRAARERGAFVIYGGIHSTLFPDEPFEHGGAHAVAKGDGDRVWPAVLDDCKNGTLQRVYDGGKIEGGSMLKARWDLLPRDKYMIASVQTVRGCPEALLVLLGVAHRRPEAARARIERGDRGAGRAAPPRLPLRRARRRQLLPGHARRLAHGRSPRRQVDLQPAQGDSRRTLRVDGGAVEAAFRHELLHADHHGSGRGSGVSRRHGQGAHSRRAGRHRVGDARRTEGRLQGLQPRRRRARRAAAGVQETRRARARLVHLRPAERQRRRPSMRPPRSRSRPTSRSRSS